MTSGEQALAIEKNRARSRANASVPKVPYPAKLPPERERKVYPMRPPQQTKTAAALTVRLPEPEAYLALVCPPDPVRHGDPLRSDGTLDVERLSPMRYAELVSIHRRTRERALRQSLGRELGIG